MAAEIVHANLHKLQKLHLSSKIKMDAKVRLLLQYYKYVLNEKHHCHFGFLIDEYIFLIGCFHKCLELVMCRYL